MSVALAPASDDLFDWLPPKRRGGGGGRLWVSRRYDVTDIVQIVDWFYLDTAGRVSSIGVRSEALKLEDQDYGRIVQVYWPRQSNDGGEAAAAAL